MYANMSKPNEWKIPLILTLKRLVLKKDVFYDSQWTKGF